VIPSHADEAVAVAGGHPLIRGVAETERGPAWRADDGRAVVLARLGHAGGIRRLLAVGAPDATADLLTSLRHELPGPVPVTVPRGSPLPLADAVDWNFRAAYEPPPPRPMEDAAAWSGDDPAHAQEIAGLLRLTGPDWTTWPGDGKARRWAVIRKGGRVLACLADTSAAPGVGALAAIAVHPDARRRGLGSAITAWATRRLFAEGRDVVTLGVYPDNAAAIRMYDELGFVLDEPRTSGVLA
jgi:ribosomal protein S18 acetylase RimI-like enzyme